MEKQEKKSFIVRHLLNIAAEISKERGWRSTPHEVSFLCPGIGDYVDGANGVLVKKLESYNPVRDTPRTIYKLHFINIHETHYWEKTVSTWDKQDAITRNQVFSFLNRVHGDGVQKLGSIYYYSLK